MSQPNRQDDDDISEVVRRLEHEFGQRDTRPEPTPVYGKAHPSPPQQQRVQLSLPTGRPFVFRILLILNVLIFFVPLALAILGVRVDGLPPSEWLLRLGAKDNTAIKLGGQYYRFLTAMFLHGGLLHIFFNGYALYSLGPETERIYGTARFLALYFIAGFAGGVGSYALSPNLSVGASGAIFGLVGGLAAFFYVSRRVLGELARQQLGGLITIVMINLFIGFSPGSNIDNFGHIGGLIGGALVGWLLAPRFEVDARLYPPVVVKRFLPSGWAGTAALFALLALLVAVVSPPS